MFVPFYLKVSKAQSFCYTFSISPTIKYFYLYHLSSGNRLSFQLPKNSISILFQRGNIQYLFLFGQTSIFLLKLMKSFLSNYSLFKNSSSSLIIFKLLLQGLGFKLESVNSFFIKLFLASSFCVFVFIPADIQFNICTNQICFFKSFNRSLLIAFCTRLNLLKKASIYSTKGLYSFNLTSF